MALDRLGVLIGIRFPGGYDGRYKGDLITNVNLFRLVFAYLSDNQALLEAKAADDGHVTREAAGNAVQKALENGRILQQLVPHAP